MMRKIIPILILMSGFLRAGAGVTAAPARVGVTLRVDGRSAILTTSRWEATIEDGMVTAFTNKLTGEVVAD